MRTIADVIGVFLFSLGPLGAFGGLMLSSVSSAGPILMLSGLSMMLVGWLVSRIASRKQCPHCAKSVNGEALKCEHCGYDFFTTPAISISEERTEPTT
jgi:hypothetical protein